MLEPDIDPDVRVFTGDAPVEASTSSDWMWPSFMPFGHELTPLAHFLIIAGVIVMILGAIVSVFALVNRINRREEAARESESLRDCVDRDDISRLSVETGVRKARRVLVSDIRSQWGAIPALLESVVDPDIVQQTMDRMLETWTDDRLVDFCVKYRRPLAVLLDAARRKRMFACAELLFDYDGVQNVPELTGIGEDTRGSFFIFTSDSIFPLSRWRAAREVLAAALDAPDIEIEEETGCVYTMYLNDSKLRSSFDTPSDLRVAIEEGSP